MESHSETTPLVEYEDGEISARHEPDNSEGRPHVVYLSPPWVLPLALLAALAMSSTAATAYFAYTTLLCRNATHCEEEESTRFAGSIAFATSVANILGVLALGPLQRLTKTRLKLGLLSWLAVRSMSAIMLLLGTKLKSFHIALCNRIFEGLASDNILHFALNTAYAQHPKSETASSFIGYSLALFMVGVSTSPFITGFLKDFTTSYIIAIALFASAAVYLQLLVKPHAAPWDSTLNHVQEENIEQRTEKPWSTLFLPLKALAQNSPSLLYGISLLAYNLVQSYIFSAVLIHNSLKFGFTAKQNGFLITLVHLVGAIYVFISLYVVPRLAKKVTSRFRLEPRYTRRRSYILAIISLSFQSTSLVGIGLASKPWQIYTAAVLLALGLPTPSFIKAHTLEGHQGSAKTELLAALAMTETGGDVIGPLLLGGWQSYNALGGSVFFSAAGMVVISLVFFVSGLVSSR